MLLFLFRAVVLAAEDLLVHVLALEELRVPRLEYAHFLQHLAHDHTDVLVVDLHALQAIHLLHFVEEIFLHRARSANLENVVRIHRTLGQTVAGTDAIAFVHAQVLARAHFVQARLRALLDRTAAGHGLDEDLTFAALDVAEAHHAVDLADRGGLLPTPGLDPHSDVG